MTLLRLTYIFLFSTAQYYIQLSRTKIDTISTNTVHLQDYNITTLKLVKYKHIHHLSGKITEFYKLSSTFTTKIFGYF